MLQNIVNKYNNKVHRTIKMKAIDVTSDFYAECNEDSNKTKPKFRAGDHSGYRNTKTFLVKDTPKIGQKKFLLLAKLKIQLCGRM